MTMKAILYVRVSTARQAEEGYGTDYQERELRRWAETMGYDVLEVIEEPGYSRESWSRPGLDRLRELAESGFRGDVLAWKRDRYFADPVYRGLFDKEMEDYGIRLRAMNDAGGDTPTSEFTDGIIDLIARLEVRNNTERTRAGKRERAHAGKYVWSGQPPYGYRYEDGQLEPDPATAPNVARIFRIVGEQGRGMNQVCRAFMTEGIPTPRGKDKWHISTISRIVQNDVYLSRPAAEVSGMVSADVAARLEPGRGATYAVAYHNRRRSKTQHNMGGKERVVTFNDPDQWIAVPIPDLGIPPEWVHAARRNVANKTSWQPNRQREWPLRGVAFCPCGRQLLTFYNVNKGHKNIYMVCPTKRSSAEDGCPHARYHRAEPLEGRVGAFVSELLRNPEVLREQVEAEAARRTKAEGAHKRHMRGLMQQLVEADGERDRYTRLYARGRLTDAEYDGYVNELDRRKATAGAELDRLRNAQRHIEDLRELVDEYLEWLPDYLETPVYKRPDPVVPGSEAVADRIYTLTPDTAEPRAEPEIDQEATARKHRAFYDRLNLRVLVHKDGTCELTWAGGCTRLRLSG